MRPNEGPKKQRKAKPLLEDVSEDWNTSFARALGSVDFHTREAGVRALTVFLQKSQLLTPLAMRKLWKGLFYCFWHSDKAAAQEDLAGRLAAVLPQLSDKVALQYFAAFMEAMQREWFGIDKLRLDKFLMLVRRFLRQLFVYLHAQEWSNAVVESYMAILKGVVDQSSEHTAAGLSFHIVDIFVPELFNMLRAEGDQLPQETLQQLLGIFVEAVATSSRASLPPRIREGVFDPVVEEFRNPSEEQPLKQCSAAVLADQIFQIGARSGVKVKARDILYELSSTLEACGTKKRKRDVSALAEQAESAQQTSEDMRHTASNIATVGDKEGGEKIFSKARRKQKEKKKRAAEQAELAQPVQIMAPEVTTAEEPKDVQTKRDEERLAIGEEAKKKKKKRKKVKDGNLEEANQELLSKIGSVGSDMPAELAGKRASSHSIEEKAVPSDTTSPADSLGSSESERLKKRKKKSKGLEEELVTRAAERTAAAIGAQKKGMTTVNPATPGTPAENNYTALMEDSLQQEGEKLDSSEAEAAASPAVVPQENQSSQKKKLPKVRETPPAATPSPVANHFVTEAGNHSTPGSQAKHVRFHLKKNLYFQKGGPLPSPDLRTPDSCRPKGSALKQKSKFSRLGPKGSKVSPSGLTKRAPSTEVKQKRSSLIARRARQSI